ncbi:hypothetical protein MTO96_005277 [Rhipicephalus appendiculatus]
MAEVSFGVHYYFTAACLPSPQCREHLLAGAGQSAAFLGHESAELQRFPEARLRVCRMSVDERNEKGHRVDGEAHVLVFGKSVEDCSSRGAAAGSWTAGDFAAVDDQISRNLDHTEGGFRTMIAMFGGFLTCTAASFGVVSATFRGGRSSPPKPKKSKRGPKERKRRKKPQGDALRQNDQQFEDTTVILDVNPLGCRCISTPSAETTTRTMRTC